MWDLPGPGPEPVSPALAGGFLTTAPPGKPRDLILKDTESAGKKPINWSRVKEVIQTLKENPSAFLGCLNECLWVCTNVN